MRLIILGSGTSIPLSYRASPSMAIFMDDRPTLFDMGPGTLRQLARIGISHDRIKHIYISHFHPDHTADLIHFLFVTQNPEILDKRDSFTITGPVGIKEFVKNLQKTYRQWLDIPPKIMKIDELDITCPDKKEYKGYSVLSRPTNHSMGSLAFRINTREGKNFVYSGDTELCDGILKLARNSDLLILECAFPESRPGKGHLTPSQAGSIADEANAKKLLLIHFYPEALATDISEDCRKTYKGELILGRDLLRIEI